MSSELRRLGATLWHPGASRAGAIVLFSSTRPPGIGVVEDVDSPMVLPAEPIIVDGVIYVPGTLNRVFAIDAATGRLLWRFDPHIRLVRVRRESICSGPSEGSQGVSRNRSVVETLR